MSEGSGQRRPPQVTWGAALAVVCGVLLVATAFDGLTGLRSVETRARLARAIDSAAAGGVDLTVADATQVLHGLLLLAGGAAAVAAVLGGYAYRRHAGARAGLAVVAVLALIGSLAADPLLGFLLVLGAGLLWSPPARAWFRPGSTVPTPASGPGHAEGADAAAGPTPFGPPAAGPREMPPPQPRRLGGPEAPGPSTGVPAPPPTYGFGTAGGPAPVVAPGPPVPYQAQAPRPGWSRWRPPAPGSVKAAVALTWTCCLLALAAFLAAAAVLANDRARVIELLQQQPGYARFADHQDALVAALWFLDGAFTLWTLSAAVLAIFVLRGHDWARVLLIVSAGGAAVVGLLAFPASVFHVVGSAVVLGLLLSRSATSWFRLPRR